MRVFIAHTIPSTIQNELADLQNLLRASNARITWTLPANIHLTLKFLGEIDDKSLDTVIETCQRATKGTAHSLCVSMQSAFFPIESNPECSG